MIFLNTHLPLCRGGGGVPHIPLMQNCPMIFLNTHHPPSGSGHLCDLHKASLASSGTTRAAHVLTKAAAGTSYRRRHTEGHNTCAHRRTNNSTASARYQCQLCRLHSEGSTSSITTSAPQCQQAKAASGNFYLNYTTFYCGLFL